MASKTMARASTPSGETAVIRCESCGGALAIDGEPKFVTCRFCGSSLRIKRTESAAFTEVIEQAIAETREVAKQAARIEKRVIRSELRERLRDLDTDWKGRLEHWTIRDQSGRTSLPSHAGATNAFIVFGVITSLPLLVMWFTSEFGHVWPIVAAMVFGTISLVHAFVSKDRAKRFSREHDCYLKERAELERALNAQNG